MNASGFYNRLIYRDLLGYGLPGAIFVFSVLTAASPIKIGDTTINIFESLSTAKLLILLGLGFVTAHPLALLARVIIRKQSMRKKQLKKAFNNYRIILLENLCRDSFDDTFGKGTWDNCNYLEKRELLQRWTSANNLHTDIQNRIESIRIFFENSMIILPLSVLVLATKINIAELSKINSIMVLSGTALLLFLLSLWGQRNVQMLEDRELIFTFIDFKIKDLKINFTNKKVSNSKSKKRNLKEPQKPDNI